MQIVCDLCILNLRKIDMGIFICFMDICLGHSGIDFDKILYPDTGEDKEYVLNAKYRLDRQTPI